MNAFLYAVMFGCVQGICCVWWARWGRASLPFSARCLETCGPCSGPLLSKERCASIQRLTRVYVWVCADDMPSRQVAYCAQQPFIQNSSLRDNILFGSPFDREKYSKTLGLCALLPGNVCMYVCMYAQLRLKATPLYRSCHLAARR